MGVWRDVLLSEKLRDWVFALRVPERGGLLAGETHLAVLSRQSSLCVALYSTGESASLRSCAFNLGIALCVPCAAVYQRYLGMLGMTRTVYSVYTLRGIMLGYAIETVAGEMSNRVHEYTDPAVQTMKCSTFEQYLRGPISLYGMPQRAVCAPLMINSWYRY